ncbi:MAG: tetratricopeptide repeat protein [Candidatus Dormibacteraeota bacterium]|nr:tetratricopeptide repeat protein [Candidatus Dormibacteraeota bacterium]
MGDRLRPFWDFDDLDATEARFRAKPAHEPDAAGRAEVLTQLARVEGLRDRFIEGERLLGEADTLAGSSPEVAIRVALERGRLLRSGGDPAAALAHFEAAYANAIAAGDGFLAADAAHMAALLAGGRQGFEAWTRRGLAIAEGSPDPAVRYWAGPLLNNLGWEYQDAGEHEAALDAFQRALMMRERFPEQPDLIQSAKEAVAEALRSLGRTAEAEALLAT